MVVDREKVHKMIEEVSQENLKRVFDFIMMLQKDESEIQADNSPLIPQEKNTIEKAEKDILNGDLINSGRIYNVNSVYEFITGVYLISLASYHTCCNMQSSTNNQPLI